MRVTLLSDKHKLLQMFIRRNFWGLKLQRRHPSSSSLVSRVGWMLVYASWSQRMFLYAFTKKALCSSAEPDLVSQTQTGFMDKFHLLSLFVQAYCYLQWKLELYMFLRIRNTNPSGDLWSSVSKTSQRCFSCCSFAHDSWNSSSVVNSQLHPSFLRSTTSRERKHTQIPDPNTKLTSSLAFVVVSSLSHAWVFATPWTVALQAPLSTGFCRQEYSGVLWFPSWGDLLNPGMELTSPASRADSLPPSHQGSPRVLFMR